MVRSLSTFVYEGAHLTDELMLYLLWPGGLRRICLDLHRQLDGAPPLTSVQSRVTPADHALSFVAMRIAISRSADTLVRLRVVGCHLWEPYEQDDQGRDIYMRASMLSSSQLTPQSTRSSPI